MLRPLTMSLVLTMSFAGAHAQTRTGRHHHHRSTSAQPPRDDSSANDATATGEKPSAHPVTLPKMRVPQGESAIEALVEIDRYQGTIHGRNGTHEIAYGHLVAVNAASDRALVDSAPVQLAMNVRSDTDPKGLPSEIPLRAGDRVEVQGIYIPASRANDHGRAVIHFTHAPDGFVVLPDGRRYR